MEIVDLNEGQPISQTSDLARLIHHRFISVKNLRTIQEQRWIESKMQFDGLSHATSDDNPNGSGIFLNFTQMKCMSAYSQIMTTMCGPNGYPWSIKPTPEPILVSLGITDTKEAERNPALPPSIKEKIVMANIACDTMRVRIADDLIEANWNEKFSRAILDLVISGTAVIKGPFASGKKKNKWSKSKTMGVFDMTQEEDIRADVDVVSPYEFYPDPAAFDIDDAMWAIQRHVLNQAQLLQLAKQQDFDEKEIMKVVEAHPKGNWSAEPWESRVFSLNKNNNQMNHYDRYVAYEHWGWMQPDDLRKAGFAIEDRKDNQPVMTCIWSVGNYCIKIAVSGLENPSLPFMVCPYERVLYSIWGRSLPEKMRDPQEIVNASARAMVDNMGIAAGPQVIYDTSRMVNGFKFDGLKPWGVWSVKSMEGMSQPPVQFVQTPSILGELKLLQDNFKLFIQEVTSMPDMTQGFAGTASGQHNRTASGMSMLFNAANSYIKGIIFNIDNFITKPLIRKIYDWNMQYSTNENMKGDFSISAGGVTELVNTESKLANMQELSQIMMDPDYKPFINKPAILKEWIRLHGFNGSEIVNSDEEAAKIMEMMIKQQAEAAQQAAPKVRSETPRPDALLQILTNTEPNSPAYPAIYELVMMSQDAMTPSMTEAIEQMKEMSITDVLTDLKSRSSETNNEERMMASQQINSAAQNQIEQGQMGVSPSPVSVGDVSQQMQSTDLNQNMGNPMDGMTQNIQQQPSDPSQEPVQIDENEIL
jgi:hypothetical protein